MIRDSTSKDKHSGNSTSCSRKFDRRDRRSFMAVAAACAVFFSLLLCVCTWLTRFTFLCVHTQQQVALAIHCLAVHQFV